MQILNIFHVLVAIALVGLVLIQKGQGATVGASFGAGASATVFGSRGAGTFLTRATWVLAALFCSISLTMAVVVSRTVGVPDTDLGVVGDAPVQEERTVESEDLPPGADISVADDEQGTSDVPEFEAPEGAGAIEGSEVRDEIPPDARQPDRPDGDGGEDSGS